MLRQARPLALYSSIASDFGSTVDRQGALMPGTIVVILPSAPTVTVGPVQALPSAFSSPRVTSQ